MTTVGSLWETGEELGSGEWRQTSLDVIIWELTAVGFI